MTWSRVRLAFAASTSSRVLVIARPSRECCRRKAFQSLSRGRKRPVHLAELCLKPDVDPSLVADFHHAPQRLVESGPHSTNYRILGVVGEVGRIEIAEVVILDPIVERATG